MVFMEGWNSVNFVPETIFSGLNDFTLVSLPMFIIMGAAVAPRAPAATCTRRSRAG